MLETQDSTGMATIAVLSQYGTEQLVEVACGHSLMEGLRDAGFEELLAICGGCCSCATCHVYIDLAETEELSPMSEDENDLLDSSEHRLANSRLSCQVPVTDALTGARVILAPAD